MQRQRARRARPRETSAVTIAALNGPPRASASRRCPASRRERSSGRRQGGRRSGQVAVAGSAPRCAARYEATSAGAHPPPCATASRSPCPGTADANRRVAAGELDPAAQRRRPASIRSRLARRGPPRPQCRPFAQRRREVHDDRLACRNRPGPSAAGIVAESFDDERRRPPAGNRGQLARRRASSSEPSPRRATSIATSSANPRARAAPAARRRAGDLREREDRSWQSGRDPHSAQPA